MKIVGGLTFVYNRVSQIFCSSVPLDNLWIRSCTPKIGQDQKKGLHVHRVLLSHQKSVKTEKKKRSSRPQESFFPLQIEPNVPLEKSKCLGVHISLPA